MRRPTRPLVNCVRDRPTHPRRETAHHSLSSPARFRTACPGTADAADNAPMLAKRILAPAGRPCIVPLTVGLMGMPATASWESDPDEVPR